MDTETAEKVEELRTLVDETISEWREWERAAQSVVSVLDDVGGAIDAEDMPGAVEDALSNVRTLDWSMPKRMDDLTDKDMVRIENLLDEIHTELADEEDEEDEEDDSHTHSPLSYLRGAISAINAGNLDDAEHHIVQALRRLPR